MEGGITMVLAAQIALVSAFVPLWLLAATAMTG
jgi:hypothetical protein